MIVENNNRESNMVKINLYLTTSKFFAYLILVIGSVFSFVFKDGSVLISTFAAASAVIAVKTYTTSQIKKSEIEAGENLVPNDFVPNE